MLEYICVVMESLGTTSMILLSIVDNQNVHTHSVLLEVPILSGCKRRQKVGIACVP